MAHEQILVKIDDHAIGIQATIEEPALRASLRALIDELVDHHLVTQASAAAGIQIGDEQLQRLSDLERTRLGLYGAAETMEWLEESGLTLEEWEALLTYRLHRQALADRTLGKDAVEVRFAEMEDHQTDVALSAIAVDNEATAIELADQVRGEEARFDELARKHSKDEDSREAGGMIGWTHLSSLPTELAALVAGSAGGGELVGPVQTGNVWYLARVELVRKPALTDALRDEIREILLDEWLAGQRDKHRIEILPAS